MGGSRFAGLFIIAIPLIIALVIAFTGSKKLKIQEIELNVQKRQRFERIRWIFNEQFPSSEIPVMLLRGTVLKDNTTGKKLLQLKFINTGEKEIKSVYATVSFIDDAGDMLADGSAIQAEYLDISCKRNGTFGQKRLLELGGVEVAHVRVAVNKIVFSDSSVWRAGQETEPSKPAKVTLLKNVLPPELQNEVSEDTVCKPEVLGSGLWRCTCGCLVADGDSCSNCQRTFTRAQEDTSIDKLEQQLQKKAAGLKQRESDSTAKKEKSKKYVTQLAFATLALYFGIFAFMEEALLAVYAISCMASMIATSVLIRRARSDGGIKDGNSITKVVKIQEITALISVVSCALNILLHLSRILFIIPILLYFIQLPLAQRWLPKIKEKLSKYKRPQ